MINMKGFDNLKKVCIIKNIFENMIYFDNKTFLVYRKKYFLVCFNLLKGFFS